MNKYGYHRLTVKQFHDLIKWNGVDYFELIQIVTGLDYDVVMNLVEKPKSYQQFEFLKESIFDYLKNKPLQKIRIGDKRIEPVENISIEWFGKKMVAMNLIRPHLTDSKQMMNVMCDLVAVYTCDHYFDEFNETNLAKMTSLLMDCRLYQVYPYFVYLVDNVSKLQIHQINSLTLDSEYLTANKRRLTANAERAGVDRLEQFGDMNLIDQFIRHYPAYKHDDVFKCEFAFVVDRLKSRMIEQNIEELHTEYIMNRNKTTHV